MGECSNDQVYYFVLTIALDYGNTSFGGGGGGFVPGEMSASPAGGGKVSPSGVKQTGNLYMCTFQY